MSETGMSFPRAGFVGMCLAGMLLIGCSNKGPTAAPVEPDTARAALKTTLDAWKAGKKPADLRSASTEIVAQDADWQRGLTLQEYEVLGSGDERDANLECQVRLKMSDSRGKPVEKQVTYVIGTDPVLTVFRKVEM